MADVLKYGAQEQAWRDVYYTRRPIHAHALCSWKPLLRNWANLHMQHAACEFLEHILGAGRPQVLQGRCESRIVSETDGTETREQQYTHKAVTLYLSDPSSPTTLQHWHKGGTYMQACTHPPKILILRISRFRAEDGSTLKLHTRVAIPCQVHIPCYREVGPACDLVMYTIVACILHCGATSQAGDYTTRFINHLPPQAASHAPPQWKADDSKPVESVKTEPMRDAVLSQRCYVILLCRS